LLPQVASADVNDSEGQDYVVRVWGADDGLTEGSVTDVAQTPEGYLWVGTLFGSVLRFDGTRFVRYNSANTPIFSLKWGVPKLMVDQCGRLWISMVNGGLTSWDQDGFHAALASVTQPDRILWSSPDSIIFAFGDGKWLVGQKSRSQWNWQTVTPPDAAPQAQSCADAQGSIWYFQNGNKIGIWTWGKTTSLGPVPGLENQTLKVMTADAKGRILIGTDQTLATWETNHFETITPTNGEAVLNIKRIIPSGDGNIWVEANGRMRRCAGRQWLAESDGWNREIGKRKKLYFLHGDNEGGLWSGVSDLGLIHVAVNGGFRRLTTEDGLPSNTIHYACEDRDGDIWTGYERGGLVQIRRRVFQNIDKNQGLSDSLINTVSEDTQGAVWIGTHSGVVSRYKDGTCTNLTLPGTTRGEDSCAAADTFGRIWIGAQYIGLLLYDGENMQLIVSQTQLGGYPRLLLPAHDGSLWLGTLWSIIQITNANYTFKYTSQDVGGHPTALAQTTDGTIWAGTLGGYLLRWDGKQFESVAPPKQKSLGRIWALWPAPDGSLWAGTEEGGLLHWVTNRFYRYTTQDGLPSDSITLIQGDAQGNLWLGTRAGVARILSGAITSFENGEIHNVPVSVYGKADGLMTIGSAIIYEPNSWLGHDGTLYFAMSDSVAEVKSAQIHVNQLPPTLALEEMAADDKLVWPENVGEVLTVSGINNSFQTATPNIQVGPGRGDLEFQYTGLSLGSPAHVRFKYRLEGLENNWNDAGSERKAIYRHVPPGRYVFRMMACNSDSVWSGDTALLAITVKPHFYQTAWFIGTAIVLTVAVLSFSVAMAMRRRMHLRFEQLENQHQLERERSRIAEDLHDELGAGLTEIGLLGGLLRDPARLAARKQEALERIVQRCNDLIVSLDEIVWAVNPRNDSVNSLGGYLCRYAQNFLEPTTIRCRLEMQEAQPDYPLNSEQRHNLFLAFEEALTNVVRHSGATEVQIKISADNNEGLFIRMEDNGRGLPSDIAEGANGLKNLRRRLAQIGGKCDITSQHGCGVSIRLNLPLASGTLGRS
jgi:signal transduction histidine kinase/ligand-binding sensor domain-containing protein